MLDQNCKLNRRDVVEDTQTTASINEAGHRLPDDIQNPLPDDITRPLFDSVPPPLPDDFKTPFDIPPFHHQYQWEPNKQAPGSVTPMYGWVCPRCGSVHAPWVNSCPYCGPKTVTRTNTGSTCPCDGNPMDGFGYSVCTNKVSDSDSNTRVTQKEITDYSINYTGKALYD